MRKTFHPLTHAQKRIWYTERFYPGTSISNLGGMIKLKSEVDFDSRLLMKAIRHFIRMNESMRLRLTSKNDGEPEQYVSEYHDFEIDFFDCGKWDNIKSFEKWGQEEFRNPMELMNADLFKFAVAKADNQEGWFFIKVHHIISDGISMVLIVNQIIDIYLEFVKGNANPQIDRPSFLEHIESERVYEHSKRFMKDYKFWKKQYAEIPEAMSIKRNESTRLSTEAVRFSKVIPESLRKEIQSFCKKNKVSELTLFLSLLYIYMHKVTGKNNVAAGTFMSNRTNALEKQMIGMFVSTIPLRTQVDENLDFVSFVRFRMKELLSVIRHQKYPYNLLVNNLREKHGQISRLFGVSLEFQVMQWHQKEHISYLIDPYFSGHETNDISLHVKEKWDIDALTMDFDYRTDLFDSEEIENLFSGMMILLEDALHNPSKQLSELEICSEEEKQNIFQKFSQDSQASSIDHQKGTLQALFEQQTAKTPDRKAVAYSNHSLTYKELNERSNRLAHHLQTKNVGPDTPVALLMDRSLEVATAIMGILKAGGAYVPIDPDLPEQRIRYILQNVGAEVLITEKAFLERLSLDITESVIIDEALLSKGNSENLSQMSDPNDLAYIIYTSGTTGKPKGVMIEHQQVVHLINGLQRKIYHSYDSPLNIAQVAPFHFDASVQQFFGSLLLGHTLFIVPKTTATNGQALASYYQTREIDVTDGTPTHLQMLAGLNSFEGLGIKHMLIGGEALPVETVEKLHTGFMGSVESVPAISNVYGPTECCVDAAAFDIVSGFSVNNKESRYMPIGRPLGVHRLYILDQHGRIQPKGVPGELHIAGQGVGRGYLNQPDLTDEKFAADPFVPGERMYKTGDLAYWLPDGNIQFIGRIDDQVKVRGYRIELGEIESVIMNHPRVRKAVVLTVSNDQTGSDLCAYIVLDNKDEAITAAEFRNFLSKELPQYMIPSYFIEIDQMPLTSSGKVDRKALLQYEGFTVSGREYVAPDNQLEERLVVIWEEVLGIDRIGMNDHFFELGGHSLKATELLSRVHQECGVEVPLQVLFETPAVKEMAQYIASAEQKAYMSIEPAKTMEHYPISSAQQRLYIVNEFEDVGIGYNMPAAIMVDGKVDQRRLEKAFEALINRHEALRTSFVKKDDVPVQRIHDQVDFEITVLEKGEETIESIMTSFVRPFDLSHAPMLRVSLLALEEKKHMLLFDMHHLISDGVSIHILLNDLAQLYKNESLPELRLQYKDYAVWQSQQLSSGYKKEERYWMETFNGELPVLQLPTDFPRPAVQSFSGDRISTVLNKEVTENLNLLAEKTGTTLYMVMLAAYQVLIAKYTDQEDIITGTLMAGRDQGDLSDIVGMFVNTLAIRTALEKQTQFTNVLQDVRQNVLGAIENQNYPFEQLVEKLNIPRDVSRHPLFDTMFVLQNAFEEIPDIGNKQWSIYETNFHIAKFDLTVQAKENKDHLTIDMDYSTMLFRKQTIKQMLSHYANLLEEVAVNPLKKLGDYHLLTEAERTRLLTEFNPPATEYPKDSSIAELFEEQVKSGPERTALVFGETSLTYVELDQRANQLANALRSRGVQKGTVVAMLMERSIEMITGVFAILKAGGAYIPIDPDHPVERIQYFLKDSDAALLLSQRSLASLVNDIELDGGCLYADDPEHYVHEASKLPELTGAGQLANLTYTSGTTGKPKGNMITHKNIIRTVKNTNYLTATDQDIFICLSNYVFDAFMFDIFGSLLNGAKLVLAPKPVNMDLIQLSEMIENENITIMMITTALFNLLIDIRPSCLSGLRKVLFGGERASMSHVRKALQVTGSGKLLHMYGPSESTVFATYYPVNQVADNEVSIPIGKPVSNTSAYILDDSHHLLPVGVTGQLCIGGDGLVSGYKNRPEINEEKYISHPFKKNERLYLTGDLARWLPNGQIEFIGRTDHQVKIRGQRIEPGEIEQQLLSHESVRKVLVNPIDQSGEKILCAYVVADHQLSVIELRNHTAKELPAYMIPSSFVLLEEMPLTSNGKVDLKALPKPDLNKVNETDYVAPRDPIEKQLAMIWEDVLGVGKMGIHDNFFELGGHSLKAITMLTRIHQVMSADVPLRVLFQSPTIALFAQKLENEKQYSPIEPVDIREVYPVSSAQKRLYALQQIEGVDRSYNMPTVMKVNGPLDVERFEAVMKQLVQRHEALRTTFETKDGEPVQRIHEDAKLPFTYKEADSKDSDRMIEEFIRPFSLQEAPLFRSELVRIAEETHLLLFDMHHIISDGISVSVLINEMTKLYEDETLEELQIQYKDYAVWQQAFKETKSYLNQEEYWLNRFSGDLPVLDLPADRTRAAVQTFDGDRLDFNLEPTLTKALQKVAKETGTTLYMVLLASYSLFLSKLSGQEDLIVGSPIAGRSHPDLEKMIGMFVNTLAVRLSPKGEKTFMDYLQDVKQTALEAFENQDYPFEELVKNVQVQREMSRNPIFDAMFVMQNMDMEDLKLKGTEIEPYPFEDNISKFDMMLSVRERQDMLSFCLEFNTSLFNRGTIEWWIKYFMQLLKQITKASDERLADVNMMPEEEKFHILSHFNDTKRVYPKNQTIQELFEYQVNRDPDQAAVVYANQSITYGELNKIANRLAWKLRDKGVQKGKIVGVMAEQSIEMAAAILSVIKAGGCYLPIDPEEPDERIQYKLNDSNVELAIAQSQFVERLKGIDVLDVDLTANGDVKSTNLPLINHVGDLAYVIYTSGSTGQPKGVMVEHRNVIRLVKNTNYIPLDGNVRMAKTGAASFDASTFEIFGALLNGGTLYPVQKSILLDAENFDSFLKKNRITTMWLTSPLFNQLVQVKAELFGTLEHLIIGGDALVPSFVNQARHKNPNLTIWNGYGPTENTTFSTCYLIDQDFSEQVPIGKPISNSSVYIVNAENQPQPIGVPGELLVGGEGVARGYLNRPELTKEKFITNPFVAGERVYRTGDLARWLPDGNIEFMGRIDHQVKVRGFRIEPAEIETQLLKVTGVIEAVIVTRKDENGQSILCAYFKGDRKLHTEHLRETLSQSLPGYMIPSYFVQVENIPLTANGKVDQSQLPELDVSAGREQEYKEPRNEREELLCHIWEGVLAVEQIGINDNFFMLGGDSIKAIQMSAQLHKHGWKLEMKDLFQNPTIEQVSLLLEPVKMEQAEQSPIEGDVPLTPIQHWFFERDFTEKHHWNQAVMLHAPEGFKPHLVEKTLCKLVEHHDALRMKFLIDGIKVSQIIQEVDKAVPQLEVIQPGGTDEDLEEAILIESERIQSSIDLSCGPLVKAALFQTGHGDHLLIAIHHLVIDGVSWRILLEDFTTCYRQAEKREEMALPNKTHSIREWSVRLKQFANSKHLQKERDYWNGLAHYSNSNLPKDKHTDDKRMRNAETVEFSLSEQETELLTTEVHKAYHTEMNDILLTALGLAIEDWAGQDQIRINLEGHGREDVIEDIDISRTVGWFTTQFPICLDMQYISDLPFQIKRIKEDLRHIPNKGIGYGLLRYLADDQQNDGLSLPSTPEIGFNYLGQFSDMSADGLSKQSRLSPGNLISLESEMMHSIDIVGVIQENALQIKVIYNALEYEASTMNQLCENYQEQLFRLIDHCLKHDEGEMTPSDLGDDEMSLEELDRLLKMF